MQPTKLARAAVLGFPVSHSLSPRLHQFWLEQYNIAGSYEAIETRAADLKDRLKHLSDAGYAGVNLTLPLKEIALGLVDDMDENARAIGAINTIVIEDGKFYGSNTDSYGFVANVKRGPVGLVGARALVLGAGGAARAVIAGLLTEGAFVSIANRTQSKAENLAREIGGFIHVIPWEKAASALPETDMLINTTSLGMENQEALQFSLQHLPPHTLVTDIVYKPLMTQLLQDAKARGNPVIDGLGMLLYQAQPAFAAWFGVVPEVTEQLRAHVLKGTLQ